MKIENTLESIVAYYGITRQVGHTYTVLNGVINNDNPVTLILGNHGSRECFKSLLKGKSVDCVSYHSLYGPTLVGCKTPLVFDNCAMYQLCLDSLKRIEDLKKENKKLEYKLESIKHIVKL